MNDLILEIKNVSKAYKGKTIIDNFSLSLRRGEIVGVTGNHGEGKTLLCRIITGLTLPDSGSVEFLIDRRSVGALVGLPAYNRELTAAENIRAQLHTAAIPGREPAADDKARVRYIIERMNVTENVVGRRSLQYSNIGERQRVALAMALVASPDLIVLDEPLAGIDVSERGTLVGMLRAEFAGKAVLLTGNSHGELDDIATRLVRIDKVRAANENLQNL
ncbi:MAG: ABC transporter ATP-binding protein [Oscillospiraceae bacterium]|jgi:ABC-2 type transport system ATP-binding protein|nr:ABC transporter ATP-binding protein [Oscillospiraceae bacterium]